MEYITTISSACFIYKSLPRKAREVIKDYGLIIGDYTLDAGKIILKHTEKIILNGAIALTNHISSQNDNQ